jgi:tRNA G46 methylase TrmB
MRTAEEVDSRATIAERARRLYNTVDENRWGRESLPEFEKQVDEWLRWSNIDQSAVVVELGCGRGAFRYLAARYYYTI